MTGALLLILKIALGLFGLGIVVFVHELGHFLAARLVGIDVEAFSIGWGNPILRKKVGGVEYRLGMFPVGGYCKMRGENEFKEAWENNAGGIEPVPGTFFGASPWRRIIVSFSGPFFNVIFAVLVMSFVWGFGFDVQTMGNKIVLASDFIDGGPYPADSADLRTGDRIIGINGKKTDYFHEIQENIVINPGKELLLTVDRQGETKNVLVTPQLDKKTGAGIIGISDWTDTVVEGIVQNSSAASAGLLPGDRIIRVNGEEVTKTSDFMKAIKPDSTTATIGYIRSGIEQNTEIIIPPASEKKGLGIIWPRVQYRNPVLSPPAALAKGVKESWKTLTVSLWSLGLLFKGIDLTEAVSGPIRITYMVGDIAAEGFGRSFSTGLRSMANFLALISIALGVMNMLPLPILDGGLIVISVVEMVRRKPLHPRAISTLQTIGVILICGLMFFAIFGDIQYLARR